MKSFLLIIGVAPNDFVFEVSGTTYNRLQRSSSWRWAKMPRARRLPARQSIGPDDDTIELSGTIITERSGYTSMNRLRELMGTGEPQLLCDSFGNVFDRWCIESVTETQTNLHENGLPRKQTFTMKMSIYGEDA
ncbi:MAG: phage tail protein [Kiritimatiellales bacterium]